jgi:hypothetical protein
VVSWCVLTFSFGLFRLPCNVFRLLPHKNLVRTINFTARMGSYVLLHLKNGFLSCWGGSIGGCCGMSCSCWLMDWKLNLGLFPIICTIEWFLAMLQPVRRGSVVHLLQSKELFHYGTTLMFLCRLRSSARY